MTTFDGGAAASVPVAALDGGNAAAVHTRTIDGGAALWEPTAARPFGGARQRSGTAVATWEPPVVEPPVSVAPVHAYIAAQAYQSATVDATGRVTLTGHATAQRRRQRDRVVVGGKDVTYWRGVPTPLPTFGLITPLLYGSGTLTLPQVHAAFERPGHGDLRFLRKGAPVLVQRVDAEGQVVATDYRGFVTKWEISGRGLTVHLGGEAAGRAGLRDKQPPIFKRRADLGHWWFKGVSDLGVPFAPHNGPTTGITLQNFGGMGHLDYLLELSAKGVTTGGAQWTCMPGTDGIYRVKRKDVETVKATVYFDDARCVPNLTRDFAEEPTRIFATAVNPNGRRIKFAVYPVLQKMDPPPFPGKLQQGDTGEHVAVLINRLIQTGYLDFDDKPGGFDWQVVRAVKELQEDADLSKTGEVNAATWEALFDVGVTGYSTSGAQILPAAQRRTTKRWFRSPSGAIVRRNPDFDPHQLVVDRTVDMGPGFTQPQVRDWARGEMAREDNWVGTITVATGGVIDGQHTPGSPVESADVRPARSLRPGDNVWAPLFDGGTLFHVSGVDVSADGTVSLAVDTRARDTMEVWEVIRRNRESRRSPARAWIDQRRRSQLGQDAVVEWDNVGGTIEPKALDQGWNVFPVVAGQEGTIARLRLATTPAAEYVVAVFGKRIGKGRLAGRVGNPLSKAGAKKWADEGVRDDLDRNHMLLYVAGDDYSPAGYWPKHKSTGEGDEDAGPLTGRWQDDAGFGYRCFDNASLWVAIYVDRATTLGGGRIMWNQLEAGG